VATSTKQAATAPLLVYYTPAAVKPPSAPALNDPSSTTLELPLSVLMPEWGQTHTLQASGCSHKVA
jgi:hypothetical protein